MTTTPAAPGKVPVLETVREGFAFVARDWRAILPLALLSAVLLAPVQVMAEGAQARNDLGMMLLAMLLSLLIPIPFLAAYYRRTTTRGEAPVALRVGGDEFNLAGTVLSLGFLFVIVVIVAMLVIGMSLAALMMRSGVDPATLQNLAPEEAGRRFVELLGADGSIVFFGLLAAACGLLLWMSSRLALAYPATVAEGRVLAFSTWAWTKGHAWSISACVVLIAICAIFLTTIAAMPVALIVEMVFGPGAQKIVGSPANWTTAFIAAFANGIFFVPPYAAAAAFLYRGLRPSS